MAGLLEACLETAARLQVPVPDDIDACVMMTRGWSRNVRYQSEPQVGEDR